ncbi:hypothetical protein C8R44DRAFT_596575, partial [Mycena epipterygia]
AARALSPRACTGTDDVTCSSSHAATASLCAELLNTIHANPNTIIDDSPRAVCLGQSSNQSSNQCCVSWSKAVGPLLQSALFTAANKVFSTCLEESLTNESGLARNVILNGVCLTECLSNRPTGCT